MSFTILLMFLSLVVIVPIAFVVRKNSTTQQLTSNQQHQRYLTNHAKQALHDSRPDLKIADTIASYQNNAKLPISFRQVLSKIKAEYLELSAESLAPDQRFTVDKLAGTRLPEIMNDYLALDSDYATEVIIDASKNLTSQDVTYGQLMSMLDFMQRIADSGQAQVASNILANRSYLQSVYGEFYEEDTTKEAVKAPNSEALADVSLLSDRTLYELGETYIADCDQLQSTSSNSLSLTDYKDAIGDSIVSQLGELVYLADNVLAYTEALFTDHVSLQAFDKIISQSIPNLLRQSLQEQISIQNQNLSNVTMSEINDSVKLTPDQQTLIEQKINRVNQLLEDCFSTLEKVAESQYSGSLITTDILQNLQNTINSKHSQAEYLLGSGFFNL